LLKQKQAIVFGTEQNFDIHLLGYHVTLAEEAPTNSGISLGPSPAAVASLVDPRPSLSSRNRRYARLFHARRDARCQDPTASGLFK
jgi:hypothetical protein